MAFEQYIKDKKAFVFEIDDVLYPQKDYLLQVYYLFAQFIEYAEQISAEEIVKSMQLTYASSGSEGIFEKTAEQFNIPLKYKVNFDLLFLSARLPLKLLMFNEMLNFLQEITVERKQIFIFTNGDPIMQLNKIKQMEWHGLESCLTVYFAAETAPKPAVDGIQEVLEKHDLKKEDLLLIGKVKSDEECAANAGIEYLNVDKLLLT
ncbi:HAD family hydrolase [Pedobacter foliorum]|uniref:HAD family hydrolase n=1 Tax=Pedobacter foliorum TaxID=2739058 RepID=UPI00156328CD|nr:HAD hydrolase-like protein [Pedobacter foliorum]NRF41464.1 HAD hydrolase-like protein [Pedobacter foliorum]